MPNMSYCRFENTLLDLSDCLSHISDSLSSTEDKARQKLVAISREIVSAADSGEIPGIPPKEIEECFEDPFEI